MKGLQDAAVAGHAGRAIETDAVIIGAGPVGLFQVFQLGLLEIEAHVIDSLPVPGGQCVELYADKPIYDIPALPVCTGRELVARLLQQIAPFSATFHLGQEVGLLKRRDDGRFDIGTSAGTQWVARAVIIAGGVGSFQPRRIKVEGLDRHEGRQLLHHMPEDTAQFAGQHVVVVGGDAAAVDAALRLAETGPERQAPASVTLLHRRDVFAAAPEALVRLRQLADKAALTLVAGQVTAFEETAGRLKRLQIAQSDGAQRSLPADRLVVLLGLVPRLGPVAEWGLALERRQVVVDTETFETAQPGIFAVGDINTYPGKKKLIVCGFHEATLAAFGVAARVFPQRATLLQYTTTSPRLHALLGVAATDASGRR